MQESSLFVCAVFRVVGNISNVIKDAGGGI